MHQNLKKSIFLRAGFVHASATPTIITTVLGSCISVCLWDKTTGIGGMNHYLSAYYEADQQISARYGDMAIPILIRKLESYGANIKNMTARVFGGSDLINSSLRVGDLNITVAKETLESAGIRVLEWNVGGPDGRKIVFNTQTGNVQNHKVLSIARHFEKKTSSF